MPNIKGICSASRMKALMMAGGRSSWCKSSSCPNVREARILVLGANCLETWYFEVYAY